MTISRRPFVKSLAGAAVFSGSGLFARKRETSKLRIGACDWSIGHKQDIGAFDTGKKIGLEGLQVSFSTPGSEFDLRDPKIREAYYQRVDQSGIKIASLGMGILNQRPLATEPEAIGWVSDVVDTMAAMKKERPEDAPEVCLLAFFGKGDLNGKPEAMESVIRKLKTVAGKAGDAGVVFGIESLLSADDHLKLIEGVGSDAIQVYYDSANSNRMGYDIYKEVGQIGGDRICEVHCKENGALLGEGVVDFPRFEKALSAAGYEDGWLIIEGAMKKGSDVVEAYRKNFATLDRVFRGMV
ncbi:MAG: sugar phosphate isomerase/epimerase [Verrucomicrobiales bacterium]|nr:sugar phosphate isomerase/epimerase [Verrucomicrobiales bacterium]